LASAPAWQLERFVLVLRSAIFQLVFYIVTTLFSLATIPLYPAPPKAMVRLAQAWGRTSLWLLRLICGIRLELRGRDNIPAGPLLVASKHQSAWETVALMTFFDYPTFVLKRELTWIPVFGWSLIKAGMIPLDREAGKGALAGLIERVRTALAEQRQVLIFPEGTRRAIGAEPDYKLGLVQIYAAGGVPCLPVALNSGLFWPRRSFLRYPGTLVVEFLPPIPAGLPRSAFFRRLQNDLESATAQLVREGEQGGAVQAPQFKRL
jgi:1-acyl-sn-glycerol-3-phosphate acyltransferase